MIGDIFFVDYSFLQLNVRCGYSIENRNFKMQYDMINITTLYFSKLNL